MSQTLGQKRVKAEFNPEKDGHVDIIKNKCAELIDILEEMRENATGEKQRLISLAQTEIENGATWAVKANFTE
jgi:hypothetical protein